MSDLLKTMKNNLYSNWRHFQAVRIVLPAMLGAGVVVAFCGFVALITEYPLILAWLLAAAAATAIALGIYNTINKAVEEDKTKP